jgi:hypothetical protein
MKSDIELRGGIVSLLAQVALQTALPYALEYALGDAGNLDKRQAEQRQKVLDEIYAKESDKISEQIYQRELGRQIEQQKKDDYQIKILEQRELLDEKNFNALESVGEQRRRLADEERMKQQELHETRVRETAERFASSRQKSTEALQRATEQKLREEGNAVEQKNAIMNANIDQLTNLRNQEQQNRQKQMEEVQRLRQKAISNEVQQRMAIAPVAPQKREVAKAKTSLRRGRGVDQEVIQYLTKTLGFSIKDAKKVLKAYF